MSIFYIETTIPSFYHEVRNQPEMVARKDWTRKWFDAAVKTDRVVASTAVLTELESGNYPGREEAIRLLDNLELLTINTAVAEVVEAYMKHKLMPVDPFGDALHLAITSYHRCDFLVTWNCRHLANARTGTTRRKEPYGVHRRLSRTASNSFKRLSHRRQLCCLANSQTRRTAKPQVRRDTGE
ncbi:MAG: hypothetical protein EA381_12295 [Planctomycetaceae bacterium]|nr:MAG: hypothetical protein EA381_12295 [Planctomycetaceae bacterium]